MKNIFRVILFCLVALMTAYGFAKFTRAAIINSAIDSSTIGASTPSSGAFTSGKFNTGIDVTGTGFKHIRATSCTTAAVANATCNTTLTWATPAFADTNYSYTCFTNGNGLAFVNSGTSASKSASQIVVVIQNSPGNSSAASEEINCIGIHDSP